MCLRPDCSIESCNTYLGFIEHLNTIGIRYAILHGWELLRDNDVSDLDIVIDACDLSLLEESLHEHYWILSMLHYEATGFAFVLLSKGSDTFSPFNVDVITDYRWRGRIFLSGGELLLKRHSWQNFWVVGPQEEFTYLLIKKIFDKGTIPERQRDRLQLLARQLGAQASDLSARYFGRSYGEQLAAWVLSGESRKIEARICQLKNALRRQTLKRGLLQPLTYWWAELRRLWGRWSHPAGLSIGIIGADRQHSNALVALILKHFSRVFRRTAVYPLSFGPGLPQTALPNSRSLHVTAAPSAAKQLFRALRYTVGYFLTIRPLLVRSTLVLRYPCDTDLSEQTRTGKSASSSRPARVTCRRLVPRPELLVVFEDGTWHLRRSPETPTAAGDQPNAYDEVSCAGISAGSAELAIRNSLVNYLTDRYMARSHVWFPRGNHYT